MALVPVLALGQKAKPGGAEADPNRGLALQVALDRAGFSPGEIDGREGPKTRAALAEFQKRPAATARSTRDAASLNLPAQPIVDYTITAQDVAGPFIDQMPRDMMDSAKLPALGYTSPLEALAERFHSSPKFLQTLNPSAGWAAGDIIKVPDVEPFAPPSPKDKPRRRPPRGAKACTRYGDHHFRRDEIAERSRRSRPGADVRAHHRWQHQRSASSRRMEGPQRVVEPVLQLQPGPLLGRGSDPRQSQDSARTE